MNKLKTLCVFIMFCFITVSCLEAAYVRSWLICGPFEGGLETECIENEAALAPKMGDVSGENKWRMHTSADDILDFEDCSVFGYIDYVVGYVYIEIKSSTEQRAKLLLGSDDGIKVWLNGVNILTHDIGRSVQLGQDKLNIVLKRGSNRLLLKINDSGGGWGVAAGITDVNGNDIPNLRFVPKQNRMKYVCAKEVAASSVQDGNVEVFGPSFVLDKDMSTRWASEHSDPQWLVFDFCKSVDISTVGIVWESAFSKEYIVYLSEDKEEWVEVYSTDKGNGGKEKFELDSPFPSRYLKIELNERATSWGNSIYEVFFLK